MQGYESLNSALRKIKTTLNLLFYSLDKSMMLWEPYKEKITW